MRTEPDIAAETGPRCRRGFRIAPRRSHGCLRAGRVALAVAVLLLISRLHFSQASDHLATQAPDARLLILDGTELHRAKQALRRGDSSVMPAAGRLRREAEPALASDGYSVTHKTVSPPGGSKHDYVSLAPYWWPNPKTADGLPYIRRDGAVNPERDQLSDRKRLDNMIQAVKTSSMAYYFFDEEKYAARAAELLRVWFLNDATKMNPHLAYAQAVPGRSQGRAAGIIETHDFPSLLDAVVLVSASPAWSKSDHQRLRIWFGSYLRWLRESSQGREEAQAKNNHGSWFDVQVASYALFTGQADAAKKTLTEFARKRIAAQIEPDGRQPHELARAQAWHYSVFNLAAMFDAAALAGKVGIDLWNFTDNGRSIRTALDWLARFAAGEKKWTSRENSTLELDRLAPLLRRATLGYRDAAYEQVLAKLPKITGDERWQLLYPELADPK